MNKLVNTGFAKFVVILTLGGIILTMLPSSASAVNQKKVLVGVGLMGAGFAIAANGASNAIFCSQNCGTHEIEVVFGLGMVGVGTFFLIKGLTEHGKHLFTPLSRNPLANGTVILGVTPIKGGWVAGARIRW